MGGQLSADELRLMSDASLVMAIARWRNEALEEVYRRHSSAVWGLATRLLSDRTRAEDVTQEVFLRLWNEPERFDAERGSLRTFLLTITHGRSIDLVRSDSSRRNREEADSVRMEVVVDDLERRVIDMSTAQHVRAAVEGLADNEREALTLTYFKGCTYREAAEILDEPEGTIKSRIRTALKRMRAELREEVDER